MYRIENNHRPLQPAHGGTVGVGNGHIEPSVSIDRHPIQGPGRNIRENCFLKVDTNCANPFYLRKDHQITWDKNYLLMRDPALRTLARIAPLDRDMATSSKYVTGLHAQPCYGAYQVQYYSNGQPVPMAGYPHS